MRKRCIAIDVITLFPSMFCGMLEESIISRAIKGGSAKINLVDLRDYSNDRHRKVDDKPYGGGPGMILRPEPLFAAVKACRKRHSKARTIFLTPQGRPFGQSIAKRLAKEGHLILICGHYEGIDERVREELLTDELSIGDYVLTCGEIPAMVLIDAVVRLLPGVLGNRRSVSLDSFEGRLLKYPQYTRPANYKGRRVPAVLLSGDHKRIEMWRRSEALKRTASRRPDLMKSYK